jgi:hypothetical protein
MSGTLFRIRTILSISTAIVFTFASVLLYQQRSQAADLTNRTIQLGSSYASVSTTHQFIFNYVTAATVGSVQFQYCANSPLFVEPCVIPAGLDTSGAGLSSQSGITGFAMSGATTADTLVITRAPAIIAPSSASYLFNDVVNPSGANNVYYVRITVFDGVDATGSVIDTGAVVFVTEEQYAVDAYVPPYLTFCVGLTVALDCSNATGFVADFGEFNTGAPTAVTSQFSVATNDGTGYNTSVSGQTMTSGANTIPGLAAQAGSSPGSSQFGINLRANTIPAIGANPQAGPVANGAPDPDYDTPNLYRYVTGDRIAGSSISSGFNRYTISYIVNISAAQAPGIYATTLTYTSVASF